MLREGKLWFGAGVTKGKVVSCVMMTIDGALDFMRRGKG